MVIPDEQTSSTRQAHLQGIALLVFAVVVGMVIAYWEASGSTGYPNAAVAPLAGLSAHPETVGVPHTGTSLTASSNNQDQVLFGRYCDSCHPAGGSGGGADMRSAQFKQQYTTPEQIVKVVRSGGFEMPAFPASLLSDDKLQQIAKYVMNLPSDGQ